MYELVAGIERYPEFVKWISALRVSNAQVVDGVQHCVGEAVVAFKGFTQSFSTAVTADPNKGSVDVTLVRGPLRKLDNRWRFVPHADGGTVVHFFVDYDFSNIVLRALARANHDLAINRIMETFMREAKRRYSGKGVA